MKTNKLHEAINATNFSTEEWDAYKKIEKNCHLCDILEELSFKLSQGKISLEQYEYLCDHYEDILFYYEDGLGYDETWHYSLDCAIDETLNLKK